VRLSTFGMLGSMAVAVAIDVCKFTLAPLVVAMLKAACAAALEEYMKDGYLGLLTSRDAKIAEGSYEQMARLKRVLEGFNYFHVDCVDIVHQYLSRGQWSEVYGSLDVRLASS
jgi:hypothetical protein